MAVNPLEGSFGGGMREATIVFSGTLDPEAFAAFAEHRAQRLAIDARVSGMSPDAVTIVVGGAPDLVDAFEMACSLGPVTCIVRDVTRLTDATAGEPR